ncbi:MAG: universal stress protein [Bacteroidia bacterium]
MKAILAPTDFSVISENAVLYAAELAKATDSKLIIFHTYTIAIPVYDVPIIPVPYEEIEKDKWAMMDDLAKKIKISCGEIKTELIVQQGFVVDEIINMLETKKADMVVMGIEKAENSSYILGSHTIDIMKKAVLPVLCIPENTTFKKPKNIALACDYKAIIPTSVVTNFKKIVHLFESHVLIFDVLKKTEIISYQKAAAEVNLEDALMDVKHSLYFASGDNLIEEINQFVKKNKVDILTIMPHNYNFIEGLFHQSISKKIALHADVPILSIHE